MQIESYSDVKNSPNYKSFVFVSEGRHGKLVKLVRFDELEDIQDTYNLALATVSSNGHADYQTISNNGDRNKILATVVKIVFIFFEKHPGKSVYLAGNDERRTLLYHRAILYAYDELAEVFNIYGYISKNLYDEDFEPFNAAGIYTGFLIEKKN